MHKSIVSIIGIVIVLAILAMIYQIIFNGVGGRIKIGGGGVEIEVQNRITDGEKNKGKIVTPTESIQKKLLSESVIDKATNPVEIKHEKIGVVKTPISPKNKIYVNNMVMNRATENLGTKITIKSINAESITFPSYLIDEDLNTTIQLNATMLKDFTYTLTFINPIEVSKIGFYQPNKLDPGEYLRTVEIRAKSSLNQQWTAYNRYTLYKDSGEFRLTPNFEFPIIELDVNPLNKWNDRGGFSYLGDIAVYGKEKLKNRGH